MSVEERKPIFRCMFCDGPVFRSSLLKNWYCRHCDVYHDVRSVYRPQVDIAQERKLWAGLWS